MLARVYSAGLSGHRWFLGRLADGVSQPPWPAKAAAAAVVVSFGGIFCVPEALDFLARREVYFFWPKLIEHLPLLFCLGYLARRANTTVESAFGLRGVRVGPVIISGFLLFVFQSILMIGIAVFLTWLGLGMGHNSRGLAKAAASSFFIFTDVTVWAPLCEELACRALLYTSLRTRCGIASSAGVTAAAFTFLHYPDTLVEIGAHFFPAVLFSLWYERTRSLWPNVLAHALHNLVAPLYFLVTQT